MRLLTVPKSGATSTRNDWCHAENFVNAHLGKRAVRLRGRDDEVGHHLDLCKHLGVVDADVQLVIHSGCLPHATYVCGFEPLRTPRPDGGSADTQSVTRAKHKNLCKVQNNSRLL